MEPESSGLQAPSASTSNNGENTESLEDSSQEVEALDSSAKLKSSSQLRYGCHKCPERFTTMSDRSTHFRTTHKTDQEQFKCDLCTETFSKERTLERHKLLHLHPTCKICLTRLESPEAMTEHMKVHERTPRGSTKKTAENQLPGIQVANDSGVSDKRRELSRVSSTADPPGLKTLLVREKTKAWAFVCESEADQNGEFICSICRAPGFKQRLHLEVHLRRHFEEYVYACRSCDHQFVSLSAANEHLKKKINCGKNTKTSNFIPTGKTHPVSTKSSSARVSTSVELPASETSAATIPGVVEREKTQAWSMARQAQKIDAVRKFICPICNVEGINDRSNLEVHIRRHLKECVCACPSCYRPFMCLSDMRVHAKHCDIIIERCQSSQDSDDKSEPAEDLHAGAAEEIPVKIKRPAATVTQNNHYQNEYPEDQDIESDLEPDEHSAEEHSETETRQHSPVLPRKGFAPLVKREQTQSFITSMNTEPYQTDPKLFECTFCGQNTFINRRNLEGHLRGRHFKEYLFSCKSCGKRLHDGTATRRHKCDRHESFEDKLSDTAEIETETPTALENVTPIELETATLTKFERFKRNKSQAYLKAIKTRPDPSTGNLFLCSICKKKAFKTRILLEMHLRFHFNEYACACYKCGKKFFTTSLLKKHNCSKFTASPQKRSESSPTRSRLNSPMKTPDTFQNAHSSRSPKGQSEVHTPDGSILFKCDHCPKMFRQRIALKFHERQHVGTLYKCAECGKGYSFESNLRRHRRDSCHGTRNDTNPQQSKISSSIFAKSLRRRNIPIRSQRPVQKPVTMRNGSTAIPVESSLHSKKLQQNGDKFSCKYCGRQFYTQAIRDGHEAIHLGKAPECPDCNKAFKNLITLRRHRLYFPCVELKSKSTKLSPQGNLQAPEDIDMEEESNEDNDDDGIQLSIENVWSESVDIPGPSHSVVAHSAKPRELHLRTADGKYKCSYCSKVYTSSWMKKYHENTHKGVKPYKCDVCLKCFHSAIRRQAHRHAVHGKRGPVAVEGCNPPEYMARNTPNLVPKEIRKPYPYKCRLCDARFSQCSNARRHMKNVHQSDEAPMRLVPKITSVSRSQYIAATLHPCQYCGNNFQNVTLLQRHVQAVHMEQRPFQCHFCHLGFLSEENFTKHVENRLCSIDKIRAGAVKASKATYTPPDGALFECCYCAKQFSNTSNLRGHERLHTGDFPYVCEICSRGYNDRRDLIYHLKRVHNMEVAAEQVKPSRPSAPRQFFKRNSAFASLRKRPKSVPSRRRYACNHCDMVFYEETELSSHAGEQTNCSNCNKVFCTEEALEQHNNEDQCQGTKVGAGEDGMFKCDYCDEKFSTPYRKKYHENRHKGFKPYKCDVCNARFFAPSSRQSHRRSYHGLNGLVTNPKCNPTEYPSSGGSKMYEKVGDFYCCLICKKQFSNSGTVTIHLRQHTGEKPYKCRDCPLAFRQAHHAKRHMLHHHNLVATPLFQKRQHLKSSHLNPAMSVAEKTSTGILKCAYCSLTFKTSYQKKYHENRHRNVKPYKCDACDRSFFSPSLRLTHRQSAHGLKGEVTAPGCNPEGYRNRLPANGNAYYAKVDGLYPCHFCEKTFARLGVIKAHERLHTGERPYKCRVCDARFVQSNHCKRHMLSQHRLNATPISDFASSPQKQQEETHETSSNADSLIALLQPIVEIEEVYRCEHCEDEFSDNEILQRHVQVVHDEPRPFHCTTCQRGFFSEANYEKHVNNRLCAGNFRTVKQRPGFLESTKKPVNPDEFFECCYCSRQFTTSHNLSVHEMRHTGEATFTCQVCGREFHAKSDYHTHLMAKHGIKPQIDENQPSAAVSSPSGKGGRTRGTGFEYPCSRCDKAFCDGALLAAHVQNFHIERRPFHCDVCQRGFFSEAAYKRHMDHQLCRRSAELELATAADDKDESAAENIDVEDGEMQRDLTLRIQMNKYPWIPQVQNGPYCYECEECDTKFTREIIAQAHRQWHRERHSNRSD